MSDKRDLIRSFNHEMTLARGRLRLWAACDARAIRVQIEKQIAGKTESAWFERTIQNAATINDVWDNLYLDINNYVQDSPWRVADLLLEKPRQEADEA